MPLEGRWWEGKRFSQWASWEMGTGLCSSLVPWHRAARGCYLKPNNYFILNITMLFRLGPSLSPSTVCEEEMPRLGVGEVTAPSFVHGLAQFLVSRAGATCASSWQHRQDGEGGGHTGVLPPPPLEVGRT